MKYQLHCGTCCRVFETDSAESSLAAVTEHERKKECNSPVYDGLKGRFLTDEEIAELRAVKV